MKTMKKITLLLFCISVSIKLMAGGYGVSLQAQKNIGMGHVGTGLYLDAGALFFNPGTLAQQNEKISLTLGVSPLFSTGYYQNRETRNTAETNNDLGTPAEFYFSYKITEQLVAGIGFYTPFGSGVKWPKDWEGRALISSIKLKSYFIQPTLSYKINESISIGAGLVFATGNVELNKDIPSLNGALSLKGKTNTGIGYNIGIHMNPTKKFSVGVSYRSKIDLEVEGGDANFEIPASIASSRIKEVDTFNSSLPMIASLNIGLAYRFTDKLTVAVDMNINKWKAYKTLDIVFDKNAILNAPQERNYRKTTTVRAGVQYAFSKGIIGRAGYYFDPSPVRKYFFSPETPSMHNHGFALGGSFQATKHLAIDLSLLAIYGQERYVGYSKDNFYGDFRSFAITPGIGISYKL